MLVDSVQSAGAHQVLFAGKELASGVYFYRLRTGQRQAVRRMLLLR